MPDVYEMCFLYRMYAADHELLYIGITGRPTIRTRQHAKQSSWWDEVGQITMVSFPSRELAATEELAAIEREQPKYNKIGKVSRTRCPEPVPIDTSTSRTRTRTRDEDAAIADALRATLISPNVLDSNWEPANVVDGLSSIARAVQNLAEAVRETTGERVDLD